MRFALADAAASAAMRLTVERSGSWRMSDGSTGRALRPFYLAYISAIAGPHRIAMK
jgi:hypothetical protein